MFLRNPHFLFLLAAVALWRAPAEGAPAEKLSACENGRKELVYYVWDTGDGRLVPTAKGFAEVIATLEVPYFSKGGFQTAWKAVGLSGWSGDWRQALAVKVTEPARRPERIEIQASWVAGPSGDKTPGDGAGEISMDGDFQPSSLTLDAGDLQRLDWLVLKPGGNHGFPRHFLVQSALTPDGPWYPVPSADFVFFPDPEKRGVWIPLRSLMARAVRVLMPRGNRQSDGKFAWSLGGAELLGGGDPVFSPGASGGPAKAAWNNLWLTFGIAGNEIHQRFDPWWETDRPLDGGMVCIPSCEWLGIGSQKLSWLDNPGHNARLDQAIAENPVGPDGYVWPSPGSDKHLGHSRHFVTNPIYCTAVAHHYLMTRDRAFLEKTEPKTGESILSKTRRAMDYQLDTLGGRSGLVTIPGREHDGTPGSLGTNYWDFWLFGHRCAYTNALFYESLRQMAELEESLGNKERAGELRALRPKVKEEFNRTFWDDKAGRYVGWVDAAGKPHDFGFTFVNLMALDYGLADQAQADKVLAWLDGKRTVEGDDSTGNDIYAFGFAPRSNTRDARHSDEVLVNTWNGAFDIQPGGNAAYGLQIQNGGAIFYVSYHDLRARNRYAGADDAAMRFAGIEKEFRKDHLRRDPANSGGVSDIVGILREFPESGLVPYFFIDGVLGIEPTAGGLLIDPHLPSDMPEAAVRDFHFAGKSWTITADRAAREPAADGTKITVPAPGSWLLTPEGKISKP